MRKNKQDIRKTCRRAKKASTGLWQGFGYRQ